jgi:uncharacterized protein (UPF0264 family)
LLPRDCQLILVYYADRELAHSPSFSQTIDVACELGSPYLLVDTYCKQAGWLGDWLNWKDMRAMIDQVHERGLKIALAGSLKLEWIDRVIAMQPDVIAVRSAACRHGLRSATLCNQRLDELLRWFDSVAMAPKVVNVSD